ncbi:uncharacterized protein LOC110459763 [Mizuhopecten yessoensis]|uniref:uncharacterized protein LOC110459763 n=1 Tax=Mizuhopecten yessoensis TaxID=6573 RepID=UPI000B4577C0|nr:uncharacterized protein LOC110459763 [Mizuhopecten yessoensis]
MEDKSVADAFKSISIEDIDYLCRLFERVQDSPNDVEEPGQMSSECRTIWEFAKCQRQESDEKYRHSLTSCYYLAAVLAEVPTSVRQLFDQTTVNLFPLLKDILLGRPRKDIVINDDILKCNKAKALLEMLDICTKESVVVAIPASQKLMVNAVWIAMLYGWHSREEQQ